MVRNKSGETIAVVTLARSHMITPVAKCSKIEVVKGG